MVNSEIWKGNLLSFHTITGTNLRKMELLDLKAAHAATITCETKIEHLGKNICSI